MSEKIVTPYSNPSGLVQGVLYPSLERAYLQGVEDADRLGTMAMQLGMTEETLHSAAVLWMMGRTKYQYNLLQIKRYIDNKLDDMDKLFGGDGL